MHIVITGANRGIGAKLAADYTAAGHTVTGTARNTPGLATLDVTNKASHEAFAASITTPVDLLVCNAGVYPDKHEQLEGGYPPEMWAEAYATNVTGVFLTVQALLPRLEQAKTPKIAIISSQMASHTRAPGGSYIYRSSKAAVLNLSRNFAADFAPKGIAVGAYHPGWVRTDMGGAEGDIEVDQSAAGLMAEFDALSLATTGCFRTWDGRDHAY
ncbi:SDR family NAD(P)-dependent oxidoreductase [Lentibacter algarum]|uniref:SDR family NAD(P)-dependent oxidoreductase n=1 Tax=Lentibacter algarum TaxID=576131 RepID=UPI001C0704CC|nr:SDR family NAD(P)-dependent oxidoreductase [Lentibacter algarum]MBU2980921.1 SDR family NAD(P)-dependent oxidoreductase [Lentibacter algarum]